MTKYEKEIYDIISHSYSHLTAEQIYEILKKKFPNVVLATVYNNLNKLYKNDFIRKLSIEGMPDRYDRTERHDHIVCRDCGKLSDIKFEDLTGSIKRQFKNDFLSYDLKVFYICPECKKKRGME